MPHPRILYLTSSWPHGQAFGGQLRALHVGRALRQIGDVTLSVVSSDIPDEEALRRSGEDFRVAPAVPVLPRPDRTLFHRARRGLDTRYYLNVHGCAADPVARTRLFHSFDNFDLIWILNSRTPNILNRWHWPKSHLDIDDIPSTYLRTVSQNASGPRSPFKAQVQQALLKRRELRFSERFITQSVCSKEDKLYLDGGDQIHVIPNGYERPLTDPPRNPATNPPRIGFMGLYTYGPNLEGVKWFLRECWPAIRQAIPGIRFRLAGKGTAGLNMPTDSGVDALGWIDDPAAEIATWSAMVIPIQFGGGTRVKIADAFSRKCPVISTRLGAFGYDVQHGRELLVVDDNDPGAFASACISSLRNPAMAAAMADRAFNTFLEKWTWDAIAPKVWAAAEDCLRRNFNRSTQKSSHMDGISEQKIGARNCDETTALERGIQTAAASALSSLSRACSPDSQPQGTARFSVVIPTFNRSRLVQRAIESVLGQTIRASQIVVVDDGSSDDTAEVCNKYGNVIEYVRQPNSGVSAARNNGIRLARHPWTAFLDSDDYWTPTHLERVAAAIDGTSGQARFYFADMRVPDGTRDDTLWAMIGFQFSSPFLLTADGTVWLLSEREPCSVQCTVFNTETLKLCGGFDPRFRVTEDRELFCRLGIRGPICAVNTVGCVQTADDKPSHRLGGIVNTKKVSYWEHERLLWAELLSRFPDLRPDDRQGLCYSLAVAHWRLSRLHWHSWRLMSWARDLLNSARAQPAFFLWLLRHGRSYGWETSVFPPCRACEVEGI